MRDISIQVLFFLLLAVLTACASTQEADDGDSEEEVEAREQINAVGPELSAASPDVRTIQLYPTRSQDSEQPREASLPVVRMNSGEALTLKFDLMEERGRPLMVRFYHADRSWERDLSPAEFMQGFQRDEILSYQPSQDAQVRYTHYDYTFPNDNVDFLVSGNYIIRVYESEGEERVLFEQAFFVSEQETDLEMYLDDLMRPGQAFPMLQPIVRFRPPSELSGNVFDLSVCFAHNGRFDQARCSDRARLSEQPNVIFDLDTRQAFAAEAADYRVDLTSLRVGLDIEETDFSASPYRVLLKPDYARFPEPGVEQPLNRQPVTSGVRDVSEPDTQGEYVQARFRFVPVDENPDLEEIYVAGSFNDWRVEESHRLSWDAERGFYEGEALVKQGEHEYTYVTRDGRRLRQLQGNMPQQTNLINAFVYYYDMNLNTDRLLAFGGLRDRF